MKIDRTAEPLESRRRSGRTAPGPRRPRSRRPGAERLEGRQLLATGLVEFAWPHDAPGAILAGKGGELWVVNSAWTGSPSVTRLATDGTAGATFPLPATDGLSSIAAGPDGSIWFADGSAKVGRLAPDGTTASFPLPADHPTASGLAAGPDGSAWFVTWPSYDPAASAPSPTVAIGRVGVDGRVRLFPVPGASPGGLTVGADGSAWFADGATSGAAKVGRVAADGTVAEFALPADVVYVAQVAAGPDGSAWFVGGTDHSSSVLGRVTAAGAVAEVPASLPDGPFNAGAIALVAAPDGSLVVVGPTRAARVTPAGDVSEVFVAAPDRGVQGAAIGPDGNLWFSEGVGPDSLASRVGRLDLGGGALDPGSRAIQAQAEPIAVVPGTPFDGLVAQFDAADPAATAAGFAATIDWGDGQSSPGKVVVGPQGGFQVDGSHTYAKAATYPVRVTVVAADPSRHLDPASASASAFVDASVGTMVPLAGLPGLAGFAGGHPGGAGVGLGRPNPHGPTARPVPRPGHPPSPARPVIRPVAGPVVKPVTLGPVGKPVHLAPPPRRAVVSPTPRGAHPAWLPRATPLGPSSAFAQRSAYRYLAHLRRPPGSR